MYTNSVIDSLCQLYKSYNITVDNLALSGNELHQLTRDFNKREQLHFSSSETLAALFYARKKGKLPRLRRKTKGK